MAQESPPFPEPPSPEPVNRSQAGVHSASTLSLRGRCVGASAAQAHPTHSSKGAVPLPGQRGQAESGCQVSQERRRLPGPVSRGEGAWWALPPLQRGLSS